MEFILNNIWLIGLVFLSGFALLWPALQQRGSHLSLLQATQMINQDKAIVVDLRSSAEFAAGHIPGAKNIPAKELPQRIQELEKFKAKSVIVVCSSGTQSFKTRAHFKSAGFNDVFILNGGLAAWQSQGLPTTK